MTLSNTKKKKHGSQKISIGELEQWCKDNVNIPIDENKLRLFISFIHLLNIAPMSSHKNGDATYKLVWQGFPVLIIVTTKFNKAFHPFGFTNMFK